MSAVAEQRAGGVPKPKALDLFAEMGQVSVLTLLAAAGVVTWVAGVAAGVAHMRRHLGGFGDSTRDYGTLFVAALRGSWWLGAASVALFGVLWVNAALLAGDAVPGGGGLLVLTAVLASLAWAVVVRAAAGWSEPGSAEDSARAGGVPAADAAGWWRLLLRGAGASASDPVGTVLLLTALYLGLLLVWMFTPMAILVPGLWVLAGVGIDHRRAARAARRP